MIPAAAAAADDDYFNSWKSLMYAEKDISSAEGDSFPNNSRDSGYTE